MNVGINGFGRIGRAIFRIIWSRRTVDCISINEPNATIQDIAYFLKYDSLYGRFIADVEIINDYTLKISDNYKTRYTSVYHYRDVAEYCNTLDDNVYVIESCGRDENISYYKNHKNQKVVFTLSSSQIESEIILGVNENSLIDKKSNIISGSICDTVALAPVLKAVFDNVAIGQTIITTMHPALNYQKVIDNYPGKGINRSLGRQYIDSIIPKSTSAENVLCKFYKDRVIKCISFRIPTESVCAAEIVFMCEHPIDLNKIICSLKATKGIAFNYDDLVSIDFKASPFSATVDMRWTEVIDNSILRILIWYDNEYGYSTKIIDLLEYWEYANKEFEVN